MSATSAISQIFSDSRLFHESDDLRNTTLSYEATFFPLSSLDNLKHKLAWRWSREVSKAQLLQLLSEDHTHLVLPVKGLQVFPIKWAYNSIPSEEEWNRLLPQSRFLIDARISGLIPTEGRSAVLVPIFRIYAQAQKN